MSGLNAYALPSSKLQVDAEREEHAWQIENGPALDDAPADAFKAYLLKNIDVYLLQIVSVAAEQRGGRHGVLLLWQQRVRGAHLGRVVSCLWIMCFCIQQSRPGLYTRGTCQHTYF